MPEDNFERKADEELSLLKRRERAGIPSEEHISYVVQQNVPSVRSDIIARFRGEPNITLLKQLLERYKLGVQKNVGVNLSKPFLCATFLSRSLGDHLTSEARNAFNENDMGKFRFFYDFLTGLKQSLDRPVRAEAELSDVGEEGRLKVVSYEGDRLKIPVEEQAEQYLNMREKDAESLKLLCKDDSGFLLMNDFAERVKTGSWHISAYQAKEYVLAGAELARDLYKELYEIAAPLYPQKKS